MCAVQSSACVDPFCVEVSNQNKTLMVTDWKSDTEQDIGKANYDQTATATGTREIIKPIKQTNIKQQQTTNSIITMSSSSSLQRLFNLVSYIDFLQT